MATKVTLQYAAGFGRGDCSDWIDYDITLSGDAEAAYLEEMQKPAGERRFYEHAALRAAISEAEEDIKEIAADDLRSAGDSYAESFHAADDKVDPDEIDELIMDEDEHTLAFFGLDKLSEEEREDWSIYDLDDDELPTYGEFYPDFEESSPFDEGYTLSVRFADEEE